MSNSINVNYDMDDYGRVCTGDKECLPLFKIKDESVYTQDPNYKRYLAVHPKMIELFYTDRDSTNPSNPSRYYLPRWAYGYQNEYKWSIIDWAWLINSEALVTLDTIKDELYDYQYKAVEAMIKSVYTTCGWLIVSGTGTGKTRMIRALAKAMGRPIVFVTPNITVQKNAVNSFEERGEELIPINWAQEPWAIDPNKSYACHYITLDMNYDKLNDGKRILVCDEAHMCPCDTLLKAICLWRCDDPMTCVFWVTATPYRTEFWEEWFKKIFWTIYHTWAEALPVKVIRFKKQRKYSIDYMMECKWDLPSDSFEIYRNMLNMDKERNKEIVDLALRCYHKNESGKVVIFCDRVDHAENIYSMLNNSNSTCQDVVLHIGKTSKQDLQKTLENKKQYIIVWSVKCLWEWLDLPALTTWILTFNTKNQKSLAQMAWRVRRNAPGKECWFLIDMADVIQVGGSKKYYGWISARANIYNELGFEIQDM